ncbi:MAG TPA: DUF6544 family protein [Ilumatobacteraceae bacterium]|nr:DUF6544 family protein [Ilumatobacteraceae bacterium]
MPTTRQSSLWTRGTPSAAGSKESAADFVSDGRSAVSTDGKTFTPQRWSTPISGYRDLGLWHLGTIGEARWHAPSGDFVDIDYHLDDITYNAADLDLH